MPGSSKHDSWLLMVIIGVPLGRVLIASMRTSRLCTLVLFSHTVSSRVKESLTSKITRTTQSHVYIYRSGLVPPFISIQIISIRLPTLPPPPPPSPSSPRHISYHSGEAISLCFVVVERDNRRSLSLHCLVHNPEDWSCLVP